MCVVSGRDSALTHCKRPRNSGISAAAWCEAGGARPGLNNSVLPGMRWFSIVRRHVARDQGVAPVLFKTVVGLSSDLVK